MQLCDYGCGREAKHYFPTVNKWCCENTTNKCPKVRRKNSESNKAKIAWNKDKTGIYSEKTINKMCESHKGHPGYWKDKNRLEETTKKISESNKFTIKQIQERFPTFVGEEEMRCNPNKPKEREIQVHCKYSECENSKENNGWFTPTQEQFWRRRDALEHDDGNDGRYFYCSEGCKQNCCLFNFRSDPNRLNEYEKYNNEVWKDTNKVLKEFSNEIKNLELRGKKYGYALDHKYSIYDGFENNIDPKIIGHWKNLQIITISENSKKHRNSSITLEELLDEIKKEINHRRKDEFKK